MSDVSSLNLCDFQIKIRSIIFQNGQSEFERRPFSSKNPRFFSAILILGRGVQSLCEKQRAPSQFKKTTPAIALWRVFIFSETDLDQFFVLKIIGFCFSHRLFTPLQLMNRKRPDYSSVAPEWTLKRAEARDPSKMFGQAIRASIRHPPSTIITA